MDLVQIVEDYFERILQTVPGIKCLVLDEETTGIISLISNQEIERLAELDEKDYVKSIQEVFADYYTLNRDLFTLNISSTYGLTRTREFWKSEDHLTMKRMFEGLLACVFSLRKMPVIRYLTNSDACSQLADMLTLKLRDECRENASDFERDSKCLLLITDRKEDPISPLLNQWSYQAMVHELIGVYNNRVDIQKGLKALNQEDTSQADPEKEFVLQAQIDQFFDQNIYSNFGELAQNIKEYIDEVSKKRSQTLKIETLEDMQKAVDNIPELKKLSGNLSKHVTLSCELSKLVEERQLMTVSRAEQELSCKDDKKEATKLVWEILNDVNIKPYEKLKTVMIFALRYENSDQISKMKEKLLAEGLKQPNINFINYAVGYAGQQKRQGDLFSTKSWQSQLKSKYKQVFANCPNIFTQHQPYICNLLEQIKLGKLKESEYQYSNLNNYRGIPTEVIVFYVGGCTYEEAKEIGIMNRSGSNIVLGGSYVHNSRTFMAELGNMSFQNQEQVIDIN